MLRLSFVGGRDHVTNRNPLGDTDDQVHLGIDRLVDRRGGEGRRHVDHGDVTTGLLPGFADGIVDRYAFDFLPGLARRDAGHVGMLAESILDAVLGMKCAGLAGDALGDDARIFIDQYTHF